MQQARPIAKPRRIDFQTALCVFSVLTLVLLLGATAVILPYNTLHSDDLLAAEPILKTWQQTHSLSEAFRRILSATAGFYRSWQGTYCAAFLGFLFEPLCIVRAPWLSPLFMIALLVFSVATFTRAVLRPFPNANRKVRCILDCFMLIGMTQLLPSAFEGYFWFSSAILYTFSFCLMLLLSALLCNLPRRKTPLSIAGAYLCAILMAVMLGGGCYPLLPPALLLLSGYVVWRIVRHDRRGAWLGGVTLAVFLCGAAANVLSIGNQARLTTMGESVGTRGIVQTVIDALVSAVTSFPGLLDGCLLLFVLLTALLAATFLKDTPYRFRLPWLAVPACFLTYASLFSPMLYTTGAIGPLRVQNIYYFALYPLLGAATTYLVGAVCAARRRGTVNPGSGRLCEWLNRRSVLAAVLVVLVLGGSLLLHGPRAVTAYAAVREVRLGIAQSYHAAKAAEQTGVPLPDDLPRSDLLP